MPIRLLVNGAHDNLAYRKLFVANERSVIVGASKKHGSTTMNDSMATNLKGTFQHRVGEKLTFLVNDSDPQRGQLRLVSMPVTPEREAFLVARRRVGDWNPTVLLRATDGGYDFTLVPRCERVSSVEKVVGKQECRNWIPGEDGWEIAGGEK